VEGRNGTLGGRPSPDSKQISIGPSNGPFTWTSLTLLLGKNGPTSLPPWREVTDGGSTRVPVSKACEGAAASVSMRGAKGKALGVPGRIWGIKFGNRGLGGEKKKMMFDNVGPEALGKKRRYPSPVARAKGGKAVDLGMTKFRKSRRLGVLTLKQGPPADRTRLESVVGPVQEGRGGPQGAPPKKERNNEGDAFGGIEHAL